MNKRETLKLITDKWEIKVKSDKNRIKVINAVFFYNYHVEIKRTITIVRVRR